MLTVLNPILLRDLSKDSQMRGLSRVTSNMRLSISAQNAELVTLSLFTELHVTANSSQAYNVFEQGMILATAESWWENIEMCVVGFF